MELPLNSVETIPVIKSVDLQTLNTSADNFGKLKPFEKVIVGAVIFKNTGPIKAGLARILLLKRSSNEEYYQLDPEDATIKHALVREILAELEPMIYTTEKTVINDTGEEVLVSKSAIQLNYVVAASDGEVKLAVNEHTESVWATEGDLVGLEVTNDMKRVIEEGFGCIADAVDNKE
ncbi:hypothetical protein QBC38DRAFT_459934 [Podospora fimiseda]|uniref:Nudix hydrolase domain-containing protein n=1 Tax=Podospora fimiseda TaxID=252190 RepID=A0AAN6YTZ4_9PEZI|nr:hypothetical protein QBC38DRAFT_459934 [Podospora fimiseda]